MGVSSAMNGIANAMGGSPLGNAAFLLCGVDISCLAPIPQPDAETQQKYEAMGLPDPVAFAALTALGAIKDPMAMLNDMMDAAQARIDLEAAAAKQADLESGKGPMLGILPGKSFVEAFQELQKRQQVGGQPADDRTGPRGGYAGAGAAQCSYAGEAADSAELERLAKQANEAADQAWAARAAAGSAGSDAANGRGVAQAFASGADDEAEAEEAPPRPVGFTLSSLLTGRAPAASDAAALLLAPPVEKVCIKLPPGTSESAVRLECARHGAVTSVILEADCSTAYVSFATSEMAVMAVRRMSNKPGVLGGSEGVQIKLISEIPENIRLASVALAVPTLEEPPVDPAELPEYLRPREVRKRSRSQSGRKRASRSTRRRKRKSRSVKRWLDRSRSHSHTATGQYIRATGCSSTVRWWEKKREGSSDSDRSAGNARAEKAKKAKKAEADLAARRPRQVGIKGYWAQFVQNGSSYYYHIRTGQTTWERPRDFEDAVTPKRPTNIVL
ncbi:unnamed protein product [Polarella glacialis]|uniref:WW domain-containing protein n=1 Tax=Polarella glacialis TaxID=89957 RepID=A0A813FTU1_POLGL|nr:unnamed protein product [Polarella glacialis]